MFDRDPVLKNVLQGGFDIQDEVGGELEREREREREWAPHWLTSQWQAKMKLMLLVFCCWIFEQFSRRRSFFSHFLDVVHSHFVSVNDDDAVARLVWKNKTIDDVFYDANLIWKDNPVKNLKLKSGFALRNR